MRSRIERSGVIATVLLAAFPASAHHSGAMYQEREISLKGVVTKVDWVNPHIYISIETDESEIWMIEGSPPAVMRKNGWTPESVVVGDAVLVTARPHNDPDRELAAGRTVLKQDGTQLVFGPNTLGRLHLNLRLRLPPRGFPGNGCRRWALPSMGSWPRKGGRRRA